MNRLTHALPSWIARGRSAVERRARHWWRSAVGGRRLPASHTLDWLLQHATADGPAPTLGGAACPGLTAAAIPTLWSLGATDVCVHWAQRLIRLQRPDGSLPDAGLLHVSLFNTAQAARAFTCLEADAALPEASHARRKACNYLASRIAADGTVRVPDEGGSFERWAPQTVRLAGLAAVVAAADARHAAQRRQAVRGAVDAVLRTSDVVRPSASLHVQLHGIEALLDLEPIDSRAGVAARDFLRFLATCQRRDGSVPADVEHAWVSSAGLAHAAALWFRIGMKDAGDRAVACLAARQQPDGSWTGSWGRNAAYFPNHPSSWTAKFALDAAAAQVQAAFVCEPPGLCDPLDDKDARLAAVLQLVGELPADARLVDVGCGNGRYLAQVLRRFPHVQTVGVDSSTTLLAQTPRACLPVVGGALRIPLDAASADAAVCIETLEHSLVPRRAVSELCRIVRPGGRVLVIDKARRRQALSLCEPWEQWFEPETVSAWLAEHCDDVRCTPLPPGPHARTPGLFLCWQGTRRGTAADARSSDIVIRRAA